jgi:hypothetical protein
MTNPFPGMNPYLEGRWDDVHHSLCMYTRNALQPQINPALVARVGERTVVELPGDLGDRNVYPDVKVTERPGGTAVVGGVVAELAPSVLIRFGDDPRTEGFVTILDPQNGNVVVTVIEFLSMSNKTLGTSRDPYVCKRDELYGAGVNLVEVDLLRRGRWAFSFPENSVPRAYRKPYRASIHRGGGGPEYAAYHMPMDRPLKPIPIPLRPGDADAVLDLQKLVNDAYADGAYDLDIDYAVDPDPPLTGDDAAWADQLLRAAGRR